MKLNPRLFRRGSTPTLNAMNKLIFPMLMSAFLGHAHAGVLNLVEPKIAWKKSDVDVCFADKTHLDKSDIQDDLDTKIKAASVASFGEDHKRLIRRLIKRQFTPDRTGISFSGWKDCQDAPESDVYLYLIKDKNQKLSGQASLGDSGYGISVSDGAFKKRKELVVKRDHHKKAYLVLNLAYLGSESLSALEEMKMTALHEFGHLAGLAHEHNDSDEKGKKYSDFNCDSSGYKPTEVVTDSSLKFSIYDKNSIMNYCYMALLTKTGLNFTVLSNAKNRISFEDPSLYKSTDNTDGTKYDVKLRLSQGDLHALKCLYVYDAATKNQICKSNYDPKSEK